LARYGSGRVDLSTDGLRQPCLTRQFRPTGLRSLSPIHAHRLREDNYREHGHNGLMPASGHQLRKSRCRDSTRDWYRYGG
jgi:hypothetical protein